VPNLYVIAGCNGAGKTTTSFTVLPEMLHCKEFVNADEIARGLSPFQPESVSFQAGRIMLGRINELMRLGGDFGFETTLATKTHVLLIQKARGLGYTVVLIFFRLETPDLAVARVKSRVDAGGHGIPPETIRRRYARGLKNLFSIYIPLADRWAVYDNSGELPLLVARGTRTSADVVHFPDIWLKIKNGR
jgi:predicted ABC-type ATPase